MTGWRSMLWAGLFLGLTTSALADGNDDVVALTRAGVGDEAIIASIANSTCTYRVEGRDIVRIRKAGVSSRVVAAMIRRCAVNDQPPSNPSDPAQALGLRQGVYVVDTGEGRTRYLRVVPAIVAAGQAGGNGSLLMPAKSKLSLPGRSGAAISALGKISFWIVSPASAANGSARAEGFEDVRLVKLEQKSDRRQLQIGASANGFVISGIKAERIIETRIARISDTVDAVSVQHDLVPGEYALIAPAGSNSYRVYDFSIR